jgi:hypothetical protein
MHRNLVWNAKRRSILPPRSVLERGGTLQQ